MANLAMQQKTVELENWQTGTMPIKVFSVLYQVKTGTIHSWISRKLEL